MTTHQVFVEDLGPHHIAAKVVSGRSGYHYGVLIVRVRETEEQAGGYRHSCNCPSWRNNRGVYELAGLKCCDHIQETFIEWGRTLA